ncbi:hypothetical protein TNCV_1889301 [Trichonephila clavipes]|nr:hypothetical protein TNCV_1889301 [Trichonephila clavipes]
MRAIGDFWGELLGDMRAIGDYWGELLGTNLVILNLRQVVSTPEKALHSKLSQHPNVMTLNFDKLNVLHLFYMVRVDVEGIGRLQPFCKGHSCRRIISHINDMGPQATGRESKDPRNSHLRMALSPASMDISSFLKTEQKSRIAFFQRQFFLECINIDTATGLIRYFSTISTNLDCIVGDAVNDLQC